MYQNSLSQQAVRKATVVGKLKARPRCCVKDIGSNSSAERYKLRG
ncbi:MAG: hypothetical protein RM368_13050 [Nostoc sp. DedSLP03]|nr:hypothetical protein [Nostoc sp. DedSLP03]